MKLKTLLNAYAGIEMRLIDHEQKVHYVESASLADWQKYYEIINTLGDKQIDHFNAENEFLHIVLK